MPIDRVVDWVVTTLLISLRVTPMFAAAPPFTLTGVPPLFRSLLGVGLAASLAAGYHGPPVAMTSEFLVISAARELVVGSVFVAALQIMFGALYVAGRTIDIQAGYGLALLIDPTTQNQTPLIGSLFAYCSAAVFFGLNGHVELLRLLQASLDAIPIGAAPPLPSVAHLAGFLTAVFATAFGVGGGAILVLFLADALIAVMSRTLPQMNVLMLGFQVKTILLLAILPAFLGASGALLTRLARQTLEAIPGLL